MFKVIVERPRRGSWLPSVKFGARINPNVDHEESPPRPPAHPPDHKELNENLAPLKRYLSSQVGRPWNKVYSEICENLDTRKATQLHILQHLFHYVVTNCSMEGKTVMGDSGWFGYRPVEGLYVHPKTGILLRARGWKRPRVRKEVKHVRVSELVHNELIDAVWYRFEYRRHDPDDVLEVVRFHEDQPKRNAEYGLREPGDRKIIRYRDVKGSNPPILVSKRQCTRAESEAAIALARAKAKMR